MHGLVTEASRSRHVDHQAGATSRVDEALESGAPRHRPYLLRDIAGEVHSS
ncbi:Hypothetical protein A7982_02126 [Minicystis rosea]|nr:Hypothetical protein A7982_02126 [Minicystis rosea]